MKKAGKSGIKSEVKELEKNRERETNGRKLNWNIFVFLTLVFCMSFMVACGQNTEMTSESAQSGMNVEMTHTAAQSQVQNNPDYLKQLTYSNLVDESSQREVREAMLSAGLSQEAVDEFFIRVNEFNASIDNKSLVEEGFVTVDTILPEYDLVYMIEALETKQPDFLGYNCRITTFGLMKQLVYVNNPGTDEDSQLFFDLDAIASKPGMMTSEELDEFKALYAHIETEKSADIEVHLRKVKEAYAKRQIMFSDSTKACMIAVYFHLDDGLNPPTVFAGHIGVLLPTSDGKLLFVEKLSFQEPYQAIKFENRTELNDYLMNKYDVDWGQETAKPFIMENGELMQGYRVIPKHEPDVPNGSGN